MFAVELQCECQAWKHEGNKRFKTRAYHDGSMISECPTYKKRAESNCHSHCPPTCLGLDASKIVDSQATLVYRPWSHSNSRAHTDTKDIIGLRPPCGHPVRCTGPQEMIAQLITIGHFIKISPTNRTYTGHDDAQLSKLPTRRTCNEWFLIYFSCTIRSRRDA